MELKPEEITKIIRNQIKNYENKIEVSETGVVTGRRRHCQGLGS